MSAMLPLLGLHSRLIHLAEESWPAHALEEDLCRLEAEAFPRNRTWQTDAGIIERRVIKRGNLIVITYIVERDGGHTSTTVWQYRKAQ